jgi:GGDEF domain-containing protein
VAAEVCDAIADQVFGAPIDRQVTASVGVSWNPAGGSFELAYSRADEALYAAKRAGRNCVKLYWQLPLPPAMPPTPADASTPCH